VFILWSLNLIAMEIDHPFGRDKNDIDGDQMQDEMNRQLTLLLSWNLERTPKLAEGLNEESVVCGNDVGISCVSRRSINRAASFNDLFSSDLATAGCSQELAAQKYQHPSNPSVGSHPPSIISHVSSQSGPLGVEGGSCRSFSGELCAEKLQRKGSITSTVREAQCDLVIHKRLESRFDLAEDGCRSSQMPSRQAPKSPGGSACKEPLDLVQFVPLCITNGAQDQEECGETASQASSFHLAVKILNTAGTDSEFCNQAIRQPMGSTISIDSPPSETRGPLCI